MVSWTANCVILYLPLGKYMAVCLRHIWGKQSEGAVEYVYVCVFTVEIVSLGHFLWVSFPVFMESSEEQHFLRGKPAFRAQTPFQALQTGNALSPIYVFHPVLCKHECRETVCVCTCIGLFQITHAHTKQRQAGTLVVDKWAKTTTALPVFTRYYRPFS